MNEWYSLLRLEREKRGWSRPKVEEITNGRITAVSLERWEAGYVVPRKGSILVWCELFGQSPEALGLGKGHDIMGVKTVYAPQEGTPMSDLIRRAVFSNLGSKLTGLIDTWPKRNYRYEELQGEIHKAVFDHHVLTQQDSIAEIGRREALKSMALVPLTIIEAGSKQKRDPDILLKHYAAGITACWYLRRGRDLTFVSDLMSTYISLLESLVFSQSEAHRKAAATLLAQSFRLKGSLSRSLESEGEGHYLEAIRYAEISGSPTEQAITQRTIGVYYLWNNKYKLSLPYAEKAYGIMKSHQDMPRNVRSYIASGLSLCRSANGKEAKTSLKEGLDLFDPTASTPSMPFSESILTAVAAAVHQHIENWQESIDLYKKSLVIPDISALGSVQTRINYAKTEVSRDDTSIRNMDLCITLLTEAITGARELNSERYKQEARACYDMLRLVWPREDAIKTLGRDHFGLAK